VGRKRVSIESWQLNSEHFILPLNGKSVLQLPSRSQTKKSPNPVIFMSSGQIACVFLVWACLSLKAVALDAIDPSFAPFTRGNGSVYSIAWQAATARLYACVSGDKFAGQPISTTLLRVDASGHRDAAYSPVIAGTARKIICLPDGKILVAGIFTSVDGHPTVNLARLLSNGNVDTSFTVSGVTLPSGIQALAVDGSGAVHVGVSADVTSRYDPITGKYVIQWPRLLYKLGVSGEFDASYTPEFAIAGVTPTSSSRYSIRINCMLPVAAGGMVVGGSFTQVNGVARQCMAKLSSSGGLDTTYAPTFSASGIFPSPSPYLQAMADAGNGKIYIGGIFTSVSGVSRKLLARLDSSGAVDSTFAPPNSSLISSITNSISSLAVDSSDRLIVAGSFTMLFSGGISRNNILRLEANGTLSTGYQEIVPLDCQLELVTGDVPYLAMSGSSWSAGILKYPLLRLTVDGALDGTFEFDLRNRGVSMESMDVVPGRGVLACSIWMREIAGVDSGSLALVSPAGQVDSSFQPMILPASGPKAALVLPDGRILIGGSFSSARGLTRPRLVLVEADGTPVSSFDLGSGPNSGVDILRLMPTGKILLGGTFTSINGETAQNVALLDLQALGANPSGFVEEILEARYGTSTASSDVLSIVRSALVDGALNLAVDATTMGGDPAPNQTKYLTVRFRSNHGERTAKVRSGAPLKLPNLCWDTGLIDRSFRPAHTESLSIKDAAGLSDGRILLLGSFSTFAGSSIKSLVRLASNGALDTGYRPSDYFASGFGPDTVKTSPTDQVYIGNFNLTTNGGTTARAMYRLNSNGAADSSFNCPSFISSWVYGIEPLPDGGVICAGSFGSTASGERKQVARLSSSGALDTGFDAGDAADSFIDGIAFEAPDRLWMWGSFNNVQGQTRDGTALIRLNAGVSPRGQVIPQSITVPDGRPVTFGLTESSTGETYVWLKNGAIIAGATGSSLTIPCELPAAITTYTARVTNSVGTAQSSGTLTVREADLAEWLADRGLNGLLTYTDSDGDGVDNLGEYLARTDPISGSSLFQLNPQNLGSTLRLKWPTYPGRLYQLHQSSDLQNWAPTGPAVAGDGTEKFVDVPTSANAVPGFWKVGVSKP
jgi:uncharacterized delta-60 repeat protein